MSADAGHPRTTIHARVGDVLALTVRGDVLDDVEIEAAGKVEPIEPGSPARFELLLDRRGEHRVDLVDADRAIGVVEVSAAARLGATRVAPSRRRSPRIESRNDENRTWTPTMISAEAATAGAPRRGRRSRAGSR